MNHIQTDLSDEALVTAIRLNLCEFYRHLSRINPREHFETEKFTRWYSHLQHPWFNGVLSSTPPQDGDEAFVEETIRHFRSRHVASFTWWTEPLVQSSEWEPLL